MQLKLYLAIILCLFAFSAQSAQYHFVSIEHLAEQEIGRIVLPKIYDKLGIPISIIPLPGNRAQSEASSGRMDGEIMRIWHYGVENPSTIRVPTPYYYLETMAFVRKDSGIVINSREDLAKYRLLKIRGVKHTNRITEGFDNVIDVDSTEKMFNLLLNKRADVALTNSLDGMMILNRLQLEEIAPIDKPLAVLPLYHYLHRSKAKMLDDLDLIIQTMTINGELKGLIEQAKQQVIGRDRQK